jgi:DNA polymerase III alpha subunit
MSNLAIINELFEQQQAKGWKPAAVWFKLASKHREGEIKLTKDDLAEVAIRLNYSPKWVEKKLEELGEPINPNAPTGYIFDGLLLVSSLKPYPTKKGDRMAFLELKSASGYEFEGIIFPSSYSEYQQELIEGQISLATGKWDFRDGKYILIVEKAIFLEQETATKIFNLIPSDVTPF